jgi:hypothetical protein
MDFTLLFALASMNFTVRFNVSEANRQDYFIFDGQDQTAHMHRENGTVYLHLDQGENLQLYGAEISEDTFKFSWSGYLIDGAQMHLLKSHGNVTSMNFDSMTFLSTIVEYSEPESVSQVFSSLKETNYWYILAIGTLIALLCKSNTLITPLLTKCLKQHGERVLYDTVAFPPDITSEVSTLEIDHAAPEEEEEIYVEMSNPSFSNTVV